MLHFTCACMLLVSRNDARSTCEYCIWTISSPVWVSLNCPRFDYRTHCTCKHILYFSLSSISLYTVQCTIWESHQSVVNENLVQQQYANSVSAQPSIGIRRNTPKQFSTKLWLWQTCQTSHQHDALRAEGRKTGPNAGNFSINLLI